MLRVSSVSDCVACRASFMVANRSPRICKVFFSSFVKEKATKIKRDRQYEVVRREVYPAVNHLDSKKMSETVRQTFVKAKELAKSNEIAIEGPPSDSLESLLAMRITNRT